MLHPGNDGPKKQNNDKCVFEEIQKCPKTALQEPAFVGGELDIFWQILGGARILITKLRNNVVSNSPTYNKHMNFLH